MHTWWAARICIRGTGPLLWLWVAMVSKSDLPLKSNPLSRNRSGLRNTACLMLLLPDSSQGQGDIVPNSRRSIGEWQQALFSPYGRPTCQYWEGSTTHNEHVTTYCLWFSIYMLEKNFFKWLANGSVVFVKHCSQHLLKSISDIRISFFF